MNGNAYSTLRRINNGHSVCDVFYVAPRTTHPLPENANDGFRHLLYGNFDLQCIVEYLFSPVGHISTKNEHDCSDTFTAGILKKAK